jgi:hypothetical protein
MIAQLINLVAIFLTLAIVTKLTLIRVLLKCILQSGITPDSILRTIWPDDLILQLRKLRLGG